MQTFINYQTIEHDANFSAYTKLNSHYASVSLISTSAGENQYLPEGNYIKMTFSTEIGCKTNKYGMVWTRGTAEDVISKYPSMFHTYTIHIALVCEDFEKQVCIPIRLGHVHNLIVFASEYKEEEMRILKSALLDRRCNVTSIVTRDVFKVRKMPPRVTEELEEIVNLKNLSILETREYLTRDIGNMDNIPANELYDIAKERITTCEKCKTFEKEVATVCTDSCI